MRPTDDRFDDDAYECLECGARTRAPEGRLCPDCGGELRSLGTARDL